jgi:hypothetical protein
MSRKERHDLQPDYVFDSDLFDLQDVKKLDGDTLKAFDKCSPSFRGENGSYEAIKAYLDRIVPESRQLDTKASEIEVANKADYQWHDVRKLHADKDRFGYEKAEYLKVDLPGIKDGPSYFIAHSYSPHDNAVSFYKNEANLYAKRPDLFFEFGESKDTAKKTVESIVDHLSDPNSYAARFFVESTISSYFDTRIFRKSDQVKENLKRATDILATGESQTIQNKELGNVYIDKGITGKNGYGLLHIIENRTMEGKNHDETTAIVHLVTQAAKEGKITSIIPDENNHEKAKHIEFEKDGIIALISRQRDHNEEKWVLTGFDNKNKKEEAAEAVKTVIADYGHTPKFSYFRKQVGAAVSSLQQLSPQSTNKSSEIETAKKAGYVQGVCECVAAVGNDYAMGRKLLIEMNVSKKMAEKYANPETYKNLEKGIFAQIQEQKIEHQHKRGRRR